LASGPRLGPVAEDYEHELARAVFRAVYETRVQRSARVAAGALLFARHTLRGMLFSWPLYLMAVAGFFVPAPVNLGLWTLAIPGIAISIYILMPGVREEYRAHVVGRLLTRGDFRALVTGRTPTDQC
jgi:hypothetical protein